MGVQREEERESFYWDYTTIATEKKGSSPRYYLQDELGSPLRVQYATGRGECYGYDEFGRDQAEEKREVSQEGLGSPYVKQGSTQPFGYTGYRYDGISGSYFAQAREYQPHTGRFMAEDVIRGKLGVPKTLNRYGYCLSNPLMYVDLNGRWPEWVENLENEFNSLKEGIEIPSKEEHYNRNQCNTDIPLTLEEMEKKEKSGEWKILDADTYHQFTAENRDNVKYVSADGYREAIYDSKGNLVTAPEDMGTYNFVPSDHDGWRGFVGHILQDVIPWYRWGNSPEDTTEFIDRVFARKMEGNWEFNIGFWDGLEVKWDIAPIDFEFQLGKGCSTD